MCSIHMEVHDVNRGLQKAGKKSPSSLDPHWWLVPASVGVVTSLGGGLCCDSPGMFSLAGSSLFSHSPVGKLLGSPVVQERGGQVSSTCLPPGCFLHMLAFEDF